MKVTPQFEVRRGSDRGVLRNDWLDARLSFSFGPYRNPARDGFGALRVLNQDVIQPAKGFAMHPHRDMEIFLLPLSGVVEHRDSLGNHAHVRPGQVQHMRAGSGIEHSQMNASDDAVDHHVQVWLSPAHAGGEPRAEARDLGIFSPGRWRMVASPDGRDGSFRLGQPVWWRTLRLEPGASQACDVEGGSMVYLHLATGSLRLDGGQRQWLMTAGDAVCGHAGDARRLGLRAGPEGALLLVFEMGHTTGASGGSA